MVSKEVYMSGTIMAGSLVEDEDFQDVIRPRSLSGPITDFYPAPWSKEKKPDGCWHLYYGEHCFMSRVFTQDAADEELLDQKIAIINGKGPLA